MNLDPNKIEKNNYLRQMGGSDEGTEICEQFRDFWSPSKYEICQILEFYFSNLFPNY